MRFRFVYTIRIVFKGGYAQDFDCYKFSMEAEDGHFVSLTWEAVSAASTLLKIDLREVAAVWTVKRRRKLVWGRGS